MVAAAPDAPDYEVYAIKYAEADALPPGKVAIGADPHDSSFDMAYYVWLIRRGDRAIVVDSGFNARSGAKRGHRLLRSPADGLRALGVEPDAVETLIVTHLHYDHFGNADLFPAATLHIQDKEAAFATGRYMRHAFFRDMYEVDDVTGFVRDVYAGRVVFHDGDGEIAPGVTVHLAPGHTPGVQFVRVWTRSGWLVLASDACHYTFLREREEVYPIVFDPGGLIETYARLRSLASSDKLVIPGHDPIVMREFPAAGEALDGVAVRLD